MRIFLLALLLVFAVVPSMADKTTRRGLKPEQKPVESTDTVYYEEVADFPDSCIVLTGYDKPLNANKESVFIINGLEYDIEGISVTITYLDKSGRQFTTREVDINIHIPTGETRQAYFPTWDRQNSFYYVRSRRPRAQATPYTITCRVTKVLKRKFSE